MNERPNVVPDIVLEMRAMNKALLSIAGDLAALRKLAENAGKPAPTVEPVAPSENPLEPSDDY